MEAFQKRMTQSTSSAGDVDARAKSPARFRASLSGVKTLGGSALKKVLTPSKRSGATESVCAGSVTSVEEDSRSDVGSSRWNVRNLGKLLDDVDGQKNKASISTTNKDSTSEAEVLAKKKKEKKSKKSLRDSVASAFTATADAADGTKTPRAKTPKPRRASCPAGESIGKDADTVEFAEFVQLDKDKRRETLASLKPQQVEQLFVDSSRKLLAKKSTLQRQLEDLQDQHVTELRRLQQQLVDANMRLKQRELVHAQRQADRQSTHQKEHQRLHQAMVASQTTFEKQATELETRTLRLMEQVAEMQSKVDHVDDIIADKEEASYFNFQLMMLLVLGVTAVWAPACVVETESASLLSTLPLWMYGA